MIKLLLPILTIALLNVASAGAQCNMRHEQILLSPYRDAASQLPLLTVNPRTLSKTTSGPNLTDYFYGRGGTGNIIYPKDSGHYVFGSGRGGDLSTPGGPKFDSQFCVSLYPNNLRKVYSIFARHYARQSAGVADTQTKYEWDDQTNSFKATYLEFWDYNGAGQLTTSGWLRANSASNGWEEGQRQVHLYNAAGKDSIIHQQGGTNWHQTTKHIFYTYDTANRITLELTTLGSASDSDVRYTTTYDAAGNRTTWAREEWNTYFRNEWMITNRSRYYFNAGNIMIAACDEQYTSGLLSTQDSMIFDRGAMPLSMSVMHYKAGYAGGYPNLYWAAWTPNFRETTVFSASKDLTGITNEKWDTGSRVFLPQSRSIYEYNSDHQETRRYTQTWIDTAWGIVSHKDAEWRHYYRRPATASAIGSLAKERRLQVTVAPIPAHMNVTYSLTCDSPIHFTAFIMDYNGQTIRQWQGNTSSSTYKETIDVRGFIPGIYYLVIKADHGSVGSPIIIR